MFDGIKIQDLRVIGDRSGVPGLLTTDRLTFGTLVNEDTGAVLDARRRATDRGLTFILTPRPDRPRQNTTGDEMPSQTHWVEVRRSLHTFFNKGRHRAAFGNANQFTGDDLLTALDRLVTEYGVDPSGSIINNIEFAVTVRLSFPVGRILDNLVSFKNRPFIPDVRNGAIYYECVFGQYVVKVYDKGKQFGIDAPLLRVEVSVTKMEYLTNRGIYLNTLNDLLNRENYGPLGALLVDTFTAILFDDSTINPDDLTPRERSIYQNGRNPRYWQLPKDLTGNQRKAQNKRLERTEKDYRAILDKHRAGPDFQTQTARLMAETWAQLTTVTDNGLTRVAERRAAWNNCAITVRDAPETGAAADGVYCLVTASTPGIYCETTARNGRNDATDDGANCRKRTAPLKWKCRKMTLYIQCHFATRPNPPRRSHLRRTS